MFFFMAGLQTEGKELGSVPVSCPECGASSQMSVFSAFECLRVFFIPVLRFHRRYFIFDPKCNSTFALPEEDGRAFEAGKIGALDPSHLRRVNASFGFSFACGYCGAPLSPGDLYCSRCGRRAGKA